MIKRSLFALLGVSVLLTVPILSFAQGNATEPQEIRELRAKAASGDAAAQYDLGRRYYEGEGIPKNYREAVKWYRRAADQGDAKAQNKLGWIFAYGMGVPENDAEAVKWYRRAADQGYAHATSPRY